MKTVFARKSIPLALPLASLVVLVILLFASTELLEAGPQEQEAQGKPVRALNRSALLDYQPGVPICEQAYNSVWNPGFEYGIGPLNGWVETGKCIFLWEDSGHNGNSSARILTTDGLKKDCKLMTIIEEIPVIPGRHYDYSAWVRTDLQAGDANLTITFW
ncbi:MAG: hypothetical protein P8189_10525, partial [Anaerolineae bacterium]